MHGRRPAAAKAALRRPAARVEAAVVSPEEWKAKFERGEVVRGVDILPGGFPRGCHLLIKEGTYYGRTISLACTVEREEIEETERKLVCVLTGTLDEELLKVGTSCKPCIIKIHLCGACCPKTRVNPTLVHVEKLCGLPGGEKTWEHNLSVEPDLEGLRQDHDRWKEEADKKKKTRSSSSSSSKGKKKKRKKKRKKKSKDREEKKEGAREEGEASSPAKKKKKTGKKIGGKAISKKDLNSVFGGTGLDPDPKVRKRLARRVKRNLRKEKISSSSSSSSSGTTGEEMAEETLLEDRNRVHRIASQAPGLLSSLGIESVKPFMLQLGNTGWELDGNQIPPLLSLYCRTYVNSRLTGGVPRELSAYHG